ncbi:MAG TPA: hypothetical protein VNB06_03600 [Thermoanaerobaculia bacterium]|nr:hypothetical protein [Thermoanaerobaculia bacterium]
MTLRAIGGLACLNALFLAVGSSVVWSLRGWRTWRCYLRLAGLAYLLGVTLLGVVWTFLLVSGVPFGGAAILLSAALVCAVALGVAIRLGRTRPVLGVPAVLTRLSLFAVAGVALAGLLAEALFRGARLQGLYAFDAWAFWIPKAEAIYFFGGLDEQVFTRLPGPTYPPLLPALDAAAFHAMGGADVVTLHLQFWFLTFGFLAAAAGILWRHVPSWILWPMLLLTFVAPRASGHLTTPQADFLLDFLFCTAALLGALWVVDRAPWRLVAATTLLGGAVLTKREGALLAAILLFALTLFTFDRRRDAWPKLMLAAGAVVAAGVPWRIWYANRGIGGEAPSSAALDLGDAREALRLSLDVFFDISLWSIVPVLAFASVVLAAVWGNRRQAVLLGAILALILLGGAWFTVAFELPITADEALNPIVRYTASAVLLGGVGSALLLAGVWERCSTSRARR